jgi:hypothetical protein
MIAPELHEARVAVADWYSQLATTPAALTDVLGQAELNVLDGTPPPDPRRLRAAILAAHTELLLNDDNTSKTAWGITFDFAATDERDRIYDLLTVTRDNPYTRPAHRIQGVNI